MNEYFGKLGIIFSEEKPSSNTRPLMGLIQSAVEVEGVRYLRIDRFVKDHPRFGLQEGDIVKKLFGKEITWENRNEVFALTQDMKKDDVYEIVVLRGEEELTLTPKLLQRMDYNVFEVDDNASKDQVFLRNVWLNNLPL